MEMNSTLLTTLESFYINFLDKKEQNLRKKTA